MKNLRPDLDFGLDFSTFSPFWPLLVIILEAYLGTQASEKHLSEIKRVGLGGWNQDLRRIGRKTQAWISRFLAYLMFRRVVLDYSESGQTTRLLSLCEHLISEDS